MTESDYNTEEAPAQALLMASFGPVQPFIAQARRTQDLWVGSRISASDRGGCLACGDQRDRDPASDADRAIFPVMVGNQVRGAMPNRFIVRVPMDAGSGLAEQAEQAARARWRAICDLTRAKFAPFAPDPASWQSLWNRAVRLCG